MKLKVDVPLDGASCVTVEVKKTANGGIVSVRPKHKRVVYTWNLADVALYVAAKSAKATAAAAGVPIPHSRKVSKSEIKSMSGAAALSEGTYKYEAGVRFPAKK